MKLARFRALAAEPLLHFLVLGTLVWVIGRVSAPPPRSVIAIDEDELAALRLEHQRRRGVPPTPDEERALVDRYVETEVLYREALALGLDRGDIIVRRRLVQKMQLLTEGDPLEAPDDSEARAWFVAHGQRYALPPTTSFEHVFLADGPDVQDRTRRARAALDAGADPRGMGDPFARGGALDRLSRDEIAARLGSEVADVAAVMPVGRWSEPLHSPYGYHLVRVNHREPARLPAFEEVASQVRLDCAREQREARARKAVAELRGRYEVRAP